MTLSSFYQKTKAQLTQAGIPTAGLDARLLVQAACGISAEEMITESARPVSAQDQQKLAEMVKRRAKGEPVSRILGRKEFWGMDFTVTSNTLDPRPDTEVLVQTVLDFAQTKTEPLHILDLGTGSGCILISLLSALPAATGVGVDVNAGAIAVSRENAEKHGVAGRVNFCTGNWFEPVAGEKFDIIVSNPPYIPADEIDSLQKEVRNHDPILALSGGIDGLDAYKTILSDIKRHLSPQGKAFFEIGQGQESDITRLLESTGATLEGLVADLAGISRVAVINCEKK